MPWRFRSLATQGELRDIPAEVVWQNYNPYPRFQGRGLGPELVFIRNDMPENKEPSIPKRPVVSHFEEVLFPYPTGISQKMGAKLKMTELVRTSEDKSGTIEVNELQTSNLNPNELELKRGKPTKRSYILAAWVRGDSKSSAGGEGEAGDKSKTIEIKPTKAGGSDELTRRPTSPRGSTRFMSPTSTCCRANSCGCGMSPT